MRRGLWLGLTLASHTGTSKSWEKGLELGGSEGKVTVLGRQQPILGQDRLAWKSIRPGRLGSDRALIQVLYELRVLPLLQDAAELLSEGAGPCWHSVVALPQEHIAVAIHPAQPAGQCHKPIGQLSRWQWGWWRWWGWGSFSRDDLETAPLQASCSFPIITLIFFSRALA